MDRTFRNDIGHQVRDGKDFRAYDERTDSWDKEYYHAKGQNKHRQRTWTWELQSQTLYTNHD